LDASAASRGVERRSRACGPIAWDIGTCTLRAGCSPSTAAGHRRCATTVEAGKVRVAAYSGEGEALLWAVARGCSAGCSARVSIVDQACSTARSPSAVARDRVLANARARNAAPPGDSMLGHPSPSRGGVGSVACCGPIQAAPCRCSSPFCAAHAPGVSASHRTVSLGHLEEAIAAVGKAPSTRASWHRSEPALCAAGRIGAAASEGRVASLTRDPAPLHSRPFGGSSSARAASHNPQVTWFESTRPPTFACGIESIDGESRHVELRP